MMFSGQKTGTDEHDRTNGQEVVVSWMAAETWRSIRDQFPLVDRFGRRGSALSPTAICLKKRQHVLAYETEA